ncbi:MAG: DNA gyrase inhibitor YacG [Nitrospiraceae bacterium]
MLVRSPRCHRESAWERNPWRPFCAERCRRS